MKSYRENLLRRLFGTGQGSGGSPHFLSAISEVILSCMDSELKGFSCNNPQRTVFCDRNEDVFVDDPGLVVDDKNGDVVRKLRTHSQAHERFLHVTGGKLALQKRFWTLIEWVWKDGKAEISKFDSSRESSTRMDLQNRGNGTLAVIKRIGHSEEYRTLRAYICADGLYNKQLSVVKKQIQIWCAKIKYSRLRNHEIRAAFNQYLLPQIGYALPVVDIRK